MMKIQILSGSNLVQTKMISLLEDELICPTCKGTGVSIHEQISDGKCFTCLGKTTINALKFNVVCPKCNGTGEKYGGECFCCKGSRVINTRRFDLVALNKMYKNVGEISKNHTAHY
jgi:DnaJ-class molecular chaperone